MRREYEEEQERKRSKEKAVSAVLLLLAIPFVVRMETRFLIFCFAIQLKAD